MTAVFAIWARSMCAATPQRLKSVTEVLEARSEYKVKVRWWFYPRDKPVVALGYLPRSFSGEYSSENQPVLDEMAGLVLVASARIDNRSDLCEMLGMEAQQAVDRNDSLILLEAYKRWGCECGNHIIGEFAFVVWDSRQQKLVGVRDHIGMRSLFFYDSVTLFAIASTQNILLPLSGIARQIDEDHLAERLIFGGEASTTLYRDVQRLLPGHTVTVTPTSLRVARYWALDPGRRLFLKSDMDYLEAFESLLLECVRCRIHGSAPLAVLLSGGLDSSTITALALGLIGTEQKPLRTFTAVPSKQHCLPERPGWYQDDTPYIEAMCSRYPDLAPRYVTVENPKLYDGIDDFFALSDAPVPNVYNFAWIKEIFRIARSENRHVILTGFFGNNTISYRGTEVLLSLMLRGRWLKLAREVMAYAQFRSLSPWKIFKQYVLAPLLSPPIRVWRRRLVKGALPFWWPYSPINPKFAEEIRLLERAHYLNLHLEYASTADSRTERIRLLTSGVTLDSLDLQNIYRTFLDVDLRDPTSDRRLVEFCLAIPEDQFFRNGQSRSLVRRVMEEKLPNELRLNPRRGLQSADWYQVLTPGRSHLLKEIEILESSESAARYLDLPRMRRLIETWPNSAKVALSLYSQYHYVLLRGIMMGKFIRWVERQT